MSLFLAPCVVQLQKLPSNELSSSQIFLPSDPPPLKTSSHLLFIPTLFLPSALPPLSCSDFKFFLPSALPPRSFSCPQLLILPCYSSPQLNLPSALPPLNSSSPQLFLLSGRPLLSPSSSQLFILTVFPSLIMCSVLAIWPYHSYIIWTFWCGSVMSTFPCLIPWFWTDVSP